MQVTLREERFVRVALDASGVMLKRELIDDVPAHVGTLTDHPVLARLDSAENILANKLTALIDREEPKDLADVWGFCCRLGLPIEDALAGAQSKAAGLFAPDIARVLLGVGPDDWRLVNWIDAPDRDGYLAELRALGERLLLVS